MAKEKLELRTGEELLTQCRGDTWRTPESIINNQVSGRFYFTNQRIAFQTWGPFKKSVMYDIELTDIEELSKYTINLIIRTGIKIHLKDNTSYKISVMKRDKYIELINQYIN